ncbi:MAG TPA: ThaI family type II restriction endonuclease [Nitrososphaera sp.]|nr:ThaI family type II restriction endonuclease [Nitrososphaera sp.]
MASPFPQIFADAALVSTIKAKLPRLFFLAELDASRAGKVGMEIGSVRERILVALLMMKFGASNVRVDIPITETEIDVIVHGQPLSIKTISGEKIGGVKAVWTVDAQKARAFVAGYRPRYDILLVQVNWGGLGKFALIPLKVQEEIFSAFGRDRYFALPKQNTNPRGVEFSRDAMSRLSTHPDTLKIEINWIRPTEKYDQYKRWLDYWSEN